MAFLRNEITRWGIRLGAATVAVMGTFGIIETLTDHPTAQSLGMESPWDYSRTIYPGNSTPSETGHLESLDDRQFARKAALESVAVSVGAVAAGASVMISARKPWS